MKYFCKNCDGHGKLHSLLEGRDYKCLECNGTGEIESAPPAAGPVNADNLIIKALVHMSKGPHNGETIDSFAQRIQTIATDVLQRYNSTPQPPAGLVWVKYNPEKKLPYNKDFYTRYDGGGNKEIMNGRNIHDLYETGWEDIEYLDESAPAQQVFSREKMKEAFHKGIAFYSSPRGYPDFETYMNTNYPVNP